jgi:hypothetical protein
MLEQKQQYTNIGDLGFSGQMPVTCPHFGFVYAGFCYSAIVISLTQEGPFVTSAQ